MNTVVVDTSVMVKWITAWGESGLPEAAALLQEHHAGSLQLVTPVSARVEFANVMRFIGIGHEDASWFLKDLDNAGIRFVTDSLERTLLATELAFCHRLTVYDALFLALAQELDCPLVTADRRAFRRVPPEVADVQLIL